MTYYLTDLIFQIHTKTLQATFVMESHTLFVRESLWWILHRQFLFNLTSAFSFTCIWISIHFITRAKACWAFYACSLWICRSIFERKWNFAWVVHRKFFYHGLICIYESSHCKTNKMACASSKDSDQPGHSPVWSESSLSAWRNTGSSATH